MLPEFFLTQGGQKSKLDSSTSSLIGPEGTTDGPIVFNEEDYMIYFDRASLMEMLQQLEEKNLFLINHVQEEEQDLEEVRKASKESTAKKQREIAELEHNIAALKESKETLQGKNKYLMSNMNIKTGEDLKARLTQDAEISRLETCVRGIFRKAGEKTEQASTMEMLTTIESRVDQLVEIRQYIMNKGG